MVEFGYLNLLLTVWNGNNVISIQPFNVLIYDDYMGGASSFIELIQELQRLIENMVIDLNNAIKITEKGKPNGVASLDKDGKLPIIQLPKEFEEFLKHIDHTVFEHHVHGLKLDDDGLLMYLDKNDNWQYVGFSDTGVGGASPLNAEVEVKDGIAKITYIGIPTVAQSKWSTGDRITSYFLLNGTTFTGTSFPVSSLGVHTLYYKDSNGVEYVKPFNVTSAMLGTPDVKIEVDDGYVTVTVPPSTNVATKKWAKGSRDTSYFAYNGTTFTGNTFQVTEIGTYTVYIKTTTDVEYVYTFEVTEAMLPIISKPTVTLPVLSVVISGSTATGHTVSPVVIDSHYKVVKYKNGAMTSYADLATPVPVNTLRTFNFMQDINFTLSANKGKEFVFGFENEIGQRTEFTLYADSQYIYYWDGENTAILTSNDLDDSWGTSSVTFPSTIKGRSITVIGQKENSVFGANSKVTTLTIPSTVKTLYPIFHHAKTLTRVNVNNPNMEYLDHSNLKWYPFHNPDTTITFRASSSSTTKTFVQERNSPKYIFQAT